MDRTPTSRFQQRRGGLTRQRRGNHAACLVHILRRRELLKAICRSTDRTGQAPCSDAQIFSVFGCRRRTRTFLPPPSARDSRRTLISAA